MNMTNIQIENLTIVNCGQKQFSNVCATLSFDEACNIIFFQVTVPTTLMRKSVHNEILSNRVSLTSIALDLKILVMYRLPHEKKITGLPQI